MNGKSNLLNKSLAVAIALFGVAAGALTSTQASANTAAETTILNVVRVDYQDATGTASFAATASTTVTVNLVESAVAISAPADQGGIASGATATYTYTLTATANGSDVYDLAVTKGVVANVAGDTVSYRTVAADGTTTLSASPTSVTLGASVVTGVPSGTQLTFPGGTLTNIASGDVVVINGNSYLVSAVSNGSGASHTNAGAAAQSTVGADTAEVLGSLTLAIHPAGSNVAPAFVLGDIGKVVAERVFLEVTTTATTNSSAPGTVPHTVETDAIADAGIDNGHATYSTTSNTTTFTGTSLTINKEVRNLNDAVPTFGATATGNPLDTLEYRVTVINTGAGDAANVVVTDAVPAYTTLVVTGVNFGTITDATNTVTLTTSVDSEVGQPGAGSEVGFADAAGTTATSALNFYVGTNSTNAAGGVVAAGATYTITYQVQIQ
jgi:uncharacterized repeat protein (TIGR01451 family)